MTLLWIITIAKGVVAHLIVREGVAAEGCSVACNLIGRTIQEIAHQALVEKWTIRAVILSNQ